MSLRIKPAINPAHPDPVTRNQPDADDVSSRKGTGDQNIQETTPICATDSTSSGGYGGHSSSAWSREAQKGTDMPLRPDDVNNAGDMGLIEQSTDGTRLDNELQDAKQGRDTKLA